MATDAADARLLRVVREWARARALRLAEKHTMERFRCEYAARGEPEVGDEGTPPCFVSQTPVDGWCASCQARDPHFYKMVSLKSIERDHLRGLCSLLDRREKARTADAVDPVDGIVAG